LYSTGLSSAAPDSGGKVGEMYGKILRKNEVYSKCVKEWIWRGKYLIAFVAIADVKTAFFRTILLGCE